MTLCIYANLAQFYEDKTSRMILAMYIYESVIIYAIIDTYGGMNFQLRIGSF